MTLEDIATEILAIFDSLILRLEDDDKRFTAVATAQRQLSLAATTLSEFQSELAARFACDALAKARDALKSIGENEPALRIETVMARLAEDE